MAPKVTLTYFPARARAELTRLLLRLGDIEFTDNRITQEEWPALKQNTPFHSVPVLNWDGEEVGQSITIARFVARKVGLAGKTDLEAAKADAIIDHCLDVFPALIGVTFASDTTSPLPPQAPNRSEENKKTKGDDFFGAKLANFLDIAEKHLQKNGGTWFVGDSMTWADVAVFHLLWTIFDADSFTDIPGNEIRGEMKGKYPGLKDLHDRVKANEKVAKWMEERPKTSF